MYVVDGKGILWKNYKTMEEEPGTIEQQEGFEGDLGMALQRQPEILPSTEFVKVEKNLASLGFFTPSSKRLRNAQEKSFTITTIADGKRMELKGTIIPSAKYGLPITADQDKWIALCKILTDILRKEGKVTNPIAFTSAEILRLLRKHRHSGKNYREVEEWLDVLFSTTIFSEGVVYLANEKRRVKDRFRVFERAVSFGKELPDGSVADKNYVWFSDWQLQNINANHLLPIDLEAYRELKNHISKALVPLLQVWLYATRDDGIFEKRYDELCQILNIRQYPYLSLISRTLAPSLDELAQFGYLADWRIERTSDDEHYKILFYHGEKFHRDRQARLNRKRTPNRKDQYPGTDRIDGISSVRHRPQLRPPGLESTADGRTFDPQLIGEFTRRGITEKKAHELILNLKPGQDVVAQLEHTDYIVKNAPIPMHNPSGFYIRLIESNTSIPDSFETSAKRKAREENEEKERRRHAEEDAQQLLQSEYDDYCATETDRHIEEHPAEFEAMKDIKRGQNSERYKAFSPDLIESMSTQAARRDVQKQMNFLTFEEFINLKQQGTGFFLKPVGLSPTPELANVKLKGESVGATVEPPNTLPDSSLTSEPDAATHPAESAMETATAAATEPEMQPAMPEPVMIELVSDPPKAQSDGDATAPQLG